MAAIYHNDVVDIDLEKGTIHRAFLNYTIGSGDNNANWFGVNVYRNDEPVDLTGCSVQGLFMPSVGSAILISDNTHTRVQNNEASVLLPQACYNVKGRFTLAIKIIGTNSYSITDTVRIVDGVVADTNSESPVAPTESVPTYQEILSVYDQMVAVKEGSVRFDTEQSLTDEQKAQARDNISGASAAEVSDLNSAISPLYTVIASQIIANSYWPYEGSSAGRPSSYSGWSRTDRLPCVEGETLKITATVASAYNVFFNTDTDGDVTGHFNLAVGENSILVPQGAHYYALSNTTSGMNNTIIKKMIDGTTVNNGIDSIVEIDNAVNGIKTPISCQSPTSGGFYYAVIGNAISVTSGTGSYYPPIDLSEYIGQKVRVAFSSTGNTSTRATALCDANGIVGGFVEEKQIVSDGYVEFDIGNTFNKLYVSYNASGSGLKVTAIDEGLIYLSEEIQTQCVYVSENGSDSNNGSITAPFATIQKAVDSGALIVRVDAGEYKSFTIRDRKTPLKIMLKDMPSQYDAQVAEVPKIKITTDGTTDYYYGVYVVNCSDIYLSDIWVDGTAYDSYMINNVAKIECVRCWCCDTNDANSMGFRLTNVNGVFRDCKAWNVSKDGFNIHLYGDTQFINCEAHDCGDDGISHHEGCNGMILGGEYYNNVKGGIASPYGGCNVNIYNAYLHNNRFGIYSQSGAEHNKSKGLVSNCVIKNNTEYDINIAKSDIIGWNNIYDTKTVDSTGSFTEF